MDINDFLGGGYTYEPFQNIDLGDTSNDAEIMSMIDPNYEDPYSGAFGGGSQYDWLNDLLAGQGSFNPIEDDPLTGSGHGLGDYNFDAEGNFTGTDNPYDYSGLLDDYFGVDGTQGFGGDEESGTGGGMGGSLDKLLASLGGIGKTALGNLTSQQGLQGLLGSGLGMYFDRQNAKDQNAFMQQMMQAQDPWVNEYKKFIPEMQGAWANREQNPAYQMRNQAMQGLANLANTGGNFKWGK